MSAPKSWVLLRGLGRESGHWGPFAESFKAAFPDRRIELLDLPGLGESLKEPVPFTMNGIVNALDGKLKADGPVGVFGLSFGGMVGLTWAARHPDRVSPLVLLNSSAKDSTPWYDRLQGGAINTFRDIFALKSEREREEKILKLVSRTADHQKEVLQLWVKIAKTRSPSRATFLRQLWAASRFKLPEFKPTTPKILCLAGMGDLMVDPECSKILSDALKADVRFHPWGGHELTLDDPTWVLKNVRDWVETPGRKS